MSRSVERREAAQRAAGLGEIRPLTRPERAAMEAALGAMRRSVVEDRRWETGISEELLIADRVMRDIARRGFLVGCRGVGLRLLRARLALHLRARLRADRGDCGTVVCTGCGEPGHLGHRAGDGCRECWLAHWQETGETLSEEKRPRYERVRIAPLWQHAALRGETAMEGM